MANRYGEAALMAARMQTYGKALLPAERWQDAVTRLYPSAPAAQKKACPRGAFVGLCGAGLVRGISATDGAQGNRNGDYAVEAARLLRAGTHKTVTQLWQAVAPAGVVHDSQMDVVLALWKNDMLVPA